MAAPLQVGSSVVIYYAKGDNTLGEIEGTVVTLAASYVEVLLASGGDVCVGWPRIDTVFVS